jgi:hypothetical protein
MGVKGGIAVEDTKQELTICPSVFMSDGGLTIHIMRKDARVGVLAVRLKDGFVKVDFTSEKGTVFSSYIPTY